MPSAAQDALGAALEGAALLDRASVDAILADFSENPGEAPLAAHRAEIDRCFAGDSVDDIIARLEAEGSEWAEEQVAIIDRMSLTSLKVTFRQLRKAASLAAIEDVMAMEFRIADRCYRGHDLFEGIRAVVIDKDGAPKWDPALLSDVGEAEVDEYFQPVPGEPAFR